MDYCGSTTISIPCYNIQRKQGGQIMNSEENTLRGCLASVFTLLMLIATNSFMYFTVYNYVALPMLNMHDVTIPYIGYWYFIPITLSVSILRRPGKSKSKSMTETISMAIQRCVNIVLTSVLIFIMYAILY